MKYKINKTHLAIVAVTLGLHYFVILLAWLLTQYSNGFPALFQMIVDRLTVPGDAVRYIDIAQNGYVKEGENAINLVFYPLYPFFMRIIGVFTGDLALAGMLVSQISFSLAGIFLYELILLDGDKKMAWDGVMLLSIYPFSMFAMGVFSEGLFLMLSIACLYAIRKENFFAAGVVGLFAALTRVQGMLLMFPAVYEVIAGKFGPDKRRFQKKDFFIFLIPCGFAVYLLINYLIHGNFFQFLIYEEGEPWYQTTRWLGDNLELHYDMARDYEALSLIIYYVQIALFFIALGVLFYGLMQNEKISYLLYGGVYLGFTYLSGWMISGGRYMLGCVPIFIVLAKVKSEFVRRMIFFAGSILFFAYSLFYLMGYAIM